MSASQAVLTREKPLLNLRDTTFLENFPNRGFKVQHQLAGQPEFKLERLVELAQRLPSNQVEYYSGKVGVNQDPANHPRNGLSVGDTVRQIEENKSWMVLKNIQADPAYHSILRDCLEEVYAECPLPRNGMHREEAFLFISSPDSVTPYHLDEEHNFLLQIRGSKEVSLWDPADRSVLSEEQIEYMLQIWHGDGYHRNMKYDPTYQRQATVFPLAPGEGLHFPVGAPHWVKNGPEVSISFSITFRSTYSERQAMVYFVNRKLRGLGLQPLPPHVSRWRDDLKVRAFQMTRSAGNVAGGSLLRRHQNKWAS